MLSRATSGGHLSRFHVDLHNTASSKISHFPFADDTYYV
jgi:hypothetical protein